jgi:hypothetical protein
MRDHRPQPAKSRAERALWTFAPTPLGGKLYMSVFAAHPGPRAAPAGMSGDAHGG